MKRFLIAAVLLATVAVAAPSARADHFHRGGYGHYHGHAHGQVHGHTRYGYRLPYYGPNYSCNPYSAPYKSYYAYPSYGYPGYYGPSGVYIHGRNYSFHYGF